MIYSLTLSAGYQCRASLLWIYLPLPCFVVMQLDLSKFFLCQLAQYIKLCQLGHYSMNWSLFLVLVCSFLLIPASCVWDTRTCSPLHRFQWCPRDGGFLASLVRTPVGISCLPVQVCSPSVNFTSVPVIAMPLQQGLNLSLVGEWPSPNLLLLWVFCLNLRQAAPFICYFCIL